MTTPTVPLQLDFGNIPVTAEAIAASMLAGLPAAALAQVLSAVRLWAISEGVRSVNAWCFQDPDDADASEVVLELRVDTDAGEAVRRWKELASLVDQVKSQLEEPDRCLLDRHLGIHLVWEDEP